MLRKKILEWDRFGPVQGHVLYLEDVEFKNTEVIFVTTPSGNKVRIQAEIDRTYETSGQDGGYQSGSIRIFHDKEKTEDNSRKIEITTVDVERYVGKKEIDIYSLKYTDLLRPQRNRLEA